MRSYRRLMERVAKRSPRAVLSAVLVGVSFLAAGHAVLAAEPPLWVQPPVTIDFNNLLNGRYSFRLQGEAALEPSGVMPISVVGSIVFDGQGKVVSAKYFQTSNGSTFRVGRDGDQIEFVSGTYSINNTEVGHVNLHFKIVAVDQDQDESWDIALTNGGKGFYINVHSVTYVAHDPDIVSNLQWTVNGQAAQE